MRTACAIACSLVVLAPLTARAYRRTTVDVDPDVAIFWPDRDIRIELASMGSSDVAPADLRAALDRSLATWTTPSCSDVVLTDVGEALATSTNLVDGHSDGLNRVVVREGAWPDDIGPETLAITSVLYDRDTGAIFDADIDLNATTHVFSAVDPVPVDDDDVENTLTHETGHLLGFAHATDPDATMFGSAPSGESSKRDLAEDDVLALCETYPTGAPTPLLPPAPHGSSCSVTPMPSAPISWLVPLAIVSARAARRARRRARADGTAS